MICQLGRMSTPFAMQAGYSYFNTADNLVYFKINQADPIMKTYIKKPIGDKNREVIEFLRDVKQNEGVSIRSLARTLDVYPNSIEQWLNPNGNPQLDSFVRLGNALGVSFSTNNTRKYVNSAEQLIDLLNKAKIYNEFSTRDLSEMTGVVQPSISGILSHKIMPRLNVFFLIADALGVELELYPPE